MSPSLGWMGWERLDVAINEAAYPMLLVLLHHGMDVLQRKATLAILAQVLPLLLLFPSQLSHPKPGGGRVFRSHPMVKPAAGQNFQFPDNAAFQSPQSKRQGGGWVLAWVRWGGKDFMS